MIMMVVTWFVLFPLAGVWAYRMVKKEEATGNIREAKEIAIGGLNFLFLGEGGHYTKTRQQDIDKLHQIDQDYYVEAAIKPYQPPETYTIPFDHKIKLSPQDILERKYRAEFAVLKKIKKYKIVDIKRLGRLEGAEVTFKSRTVDKQDMARIMMASRQKLTTIAEAGGQVNLVKAWYDQAPKNALTEQILAEYIYWYNFDKFSSTVPLKLGPEQSFVLHISEDHMGFFIDFEEFNRLKRSLVV